MNTFEIQSRLPLRAHHPDPQHLLQRQSPLRRGFLIETVHLLGDHVHNKQVDLPANPVVRDQIPGRGPTRQTVIRQAPQLFPQGIRQARRVGR